MSTGPIGGVLGSVAGAPLSQTKGATTERQAANNAAKETADQLDLKTEKSAGVGQTECDQQSSDRDADGRRMWERQQAKDSDSSQTEGAEAGIPDASGPEPGGLDLLA